MFAAETLQVARIINGQFVNTNETFYYYNGTLLNDSCVQLRCPLLRPIWLILSPARSNAVNLSLAGTPLQQKTFLIGTLTARNSTGQIGPTGIPNPTDDGPSDGGGGRSGQPPAMIALYVVTGCISAMFALMIGMAARRAIRHPERYGRREGNENEAAQTRAGGIAQALLDTFPIIKFNRRDGPPKDMDSETEMETRQLPRASREGNSGAAAAAADPFDDRRGTNRNSANIRSTVTTGTGSVSYHSTLPRHGNDAEQDDEDDISVKSVERATAAYESLEPRSRAVSSSGSRPEQAASASAETPGDMEEQCPICLLDFEDGEDLRVLPCEKEHVYHQTCIDPWLLDVSSSCPLCRKGMPFLFPESRTFMGSMSYKLLTYRARLQSTARAQYRRRRLVIIRPSTHRLGVRKVSGLYAPRKADRARS